MTHRAKDAKAVSPKRLSPPFLCHNPTCKQRLTESQDICPSCQTSAELGRHYRLCQPIAEGGMGRTFLAQDQRFLGDTNEYCVVKEIKSEEQQPQFAEQLQREASRLLNLRHPHIPAYRDFFKEIDDSGHARWFLVQEHIEGKDLQAQLDQYGPFGVEHALEILRDVLQILSYIHEMQDHKTGKNAPILHLDIKPANLIERKSDGKIFLIDFGVASQIHNTIVATYGAQATIQGFTPGFAPFEQTMGYAAPASDLYALCMTFLVLVSGQSPFALISPLEQITTFQQFIKLPPGLSTLMEKMLSVHVKERVSSAKELLEHLQRLEQNNFTMPFIANSSAPPRQQPVLASGIFTASPTGHPNSPPSAQTSEPLAQTDGIQAPIATPHSQPTAPPSLPLLQQNDTPQRPNTRLREIAILLVGMGLMAGTWLGSRWFLPKQHSDNPKTIGMARNVQPPTKTTVSPTKRVPEARRKQPSPRKKTQPSAPPKTRPIQRKAQRRQSAKARRKPPEKRRRRRIAKRKRHKHRIPDDEFKRLMLDVRANKPTKVRRIALRMLGLKRETRSIGYLRDLMLVELDWSMRFSIAKTIAQMGKPGTRVLLPFLRHQNSKLAITTARALSLQGPPNRRHAAKIYKALLRNTRHTSFMLRTVIIAMDRINAPNHIKRKAMVYVLRRSRYNYDNSFYIGKLKRWKIPAKTITRTLMKDFAALSKRHKEYILRVLCMMGPGAQNTLSLLRRVMMKDPAYYVRIKAAGTLLSINGLRTHPWVERAIREETHRVARNMMRGYFRCGQNDKRCLCR